MKKIAGVTLPLTLVLLLLVSGSVAVAAPSPTAEFAADCNADGELLVDGVRSFSNEVGVLTRPCLVIMTAGSRLKLRSFHLTGVLGGLAVDGANDTTIHISNSYIDLGQYVQLSPGCCAGDSTVPEQDSTLIVRHSGIRGDTVELSASTASSGGTVRLYGVKVKASNTGLFAITVGGSERDDRTIVSGSNFETLGGLRIESGISGFTKVTNSILDSPNVLIATGLGGICKTLDNAPLVACTP